MKKKTAALFLALAFFLTSCTEGEATENTSGPQITWTFPDITEFFETTPENTPEESDKPEKTPSPESPASASAAPVTESPETSDEQTARSERKLPFSIYDSLAEHYDDITPAQYVVIDQACFPDYGPESRGMSFPSDDKEAENAALRAYRESDYYREALETAREFFAYENGELVISESNWVTDAYAEYIDEAAAPEIELKAKVVDSEKAKFDGKTEESIFFLSVALPESCFVSSGEWASFSVPVYVNSAGEAFILDSAGYQARIEVSFVKYVKSGKIHMESGGAHSQGTAKDAVFSFENGQPKEELYLYGSILVMEDNGRVFEWVRGFCYYSFIFYSDELSRYCGIKAVPVSEKAAEAICSDKNILQKIPDIKERYEDGQVTVLGGKYVLSGYNSFEYDGTGFAATYEGRYQYFIPVLPQSNDPPFGDKYVFNVPIDGPPK